MSVEPAPAVSASPDRVFARAVGLALGAGLMLALAGHLALGRALIEHGRRAELALTAGAELAAARAVADGLDRIAALPEGAEQRIARSRLVWEVDRLVALEDRRLAQTPGLAPAPSSDLLRAAATVRELAQRAVADRDAAAALRDGFTAQVLPQLELIASRQRAEAARSRERGARVLAASVALHLLVGGLLVAGVLLPARRRIAAWVARSRDADRENRFRLLHDPLSGLPNATYLEAHLARAAARGGRSARQTAVLRVDLDRYRLLRDTLGQGACDEIVRLCARRLRQCLRGEDLAAHVGRESFVVVAEEIEDGSDVAALAGRVQAALARPLSIRGGARRITCSIGVTLLSDEPDAAPERILANAAIALDAARRGGSGHVSYFRESLRQEVERRETLFTELSSALERHEIVPYFQPQVALATGAFAGFESLVRWRHPRLGLLAPASFLDFAEQTDLTERLGEVVLTATLEAIRAWDAAGLHVPRVGINFALAQLRDPRLIEKIKWEAERFDVEPGRIAIEVLETVLIKSDADMVVRNLRGLASAGFHVELDDFGTGHASIANLRRFVVSRIKIDRSFVAGVEDREEQQKLTGSMIAMAHALGIGTLAEGVETAEAAAALRRLGCDFVQGYFLAEPMAPAETVPWLQAHGAGAGPILPPPAPAAADPNTP